MIDRTWRTGLRALLTMAVLALTPAGGTLLHQDPPGRASRKSRF